MGCNPTITAPPRRNYIKRRGEAVRLDRLTLRPTHPRRFPKPKLRHHHARLPTSLLYSIKKMSKKASA